MPGALAFSLDDIHYSLQTIVHRYLDHSHSQRMVMIGRAASYDDGDYSPEAEHVFHVLDDRLDHLKLLLTELPQFPKKSGPKVVEEWMGHIELVTSHLVRLFDADFLTASIPRAMALALHQEIEAFRKTVAKVLITIRDHAVSEWVSSPTCLFSTKGARNLCRLVGGSEASYDGFLLLRIMRETLNSGRIMRQAIENARELALRGLPPCPIAALAIDDLYWNAAAALSEGFIKQIREERAGEVRFNEEFLSNFADADAANSTVSPGGIPSPSETSPEPDFELRSADQLRAILREVGIVSLERFLQINENLPADMLPVQFIPKTLWNHLDKISQVQKALDLVSGYSGEKGQHQVSEKERLELSGTVRYERTQNRRLFGIWLSTGEFDDECLKQITKGEARLNAALEKWEPLLNGSAIATGPIKPLRRPAP